MLCSFLLPIPTDSDELSHLNALARILAASQLVRAPSCPAIQILSFYPSFDNDDKVNERYLSPNLSNRSEPPHLLPRLSLTSIGPQRLAHLVHLPPDDISLGSKELGEDGRHLRHDGFWRGNDVDPSSGGAIVVRSSSDLQVHRSRCQGE